MRRNDTYFNSGIEDAIARAGISSPQGLQPPPPKKPKQRKGISKAETMLYDFSAHYTHHALHVQATIQRNHLR